MCLKKLDIRDYINHSFTMKSTLYQICGEIHIHN